MTRQWFVGLLMACLLLLGGISVPAAAHKEHKKKHPVAEHVQLPAAPGGENALAQQQDPTAEHATIGEELEAAEPNRSSMSFAERLLDWLGRLHPVIVHFPIAFFPAALLTAVVGRRRPAFAAPVQFLVIAGAIIAPLAAVLGWLDAMTADPSPLLTVHRWLGTAIGAGALGLGLWAWRRPNSVRSTAMIFALSAITAAIVIQGWYGGAMVHGMDHMNW
jgi:uncharacterized membrane protein